MTFVRDRSEKAIKLAMETTLILIIGKTIHQKYKCTIEQCIL